MFVGTLNLTHENFSTVLQVLHTRFRCQFKYFEKRAKDGLPDSNGLCLHMQLPSFGREHWPIERYLGARRVSAESAASKGNKRSPHDRKIAIATQHLLFMNINFREQDRLLKYFKKYSC